MSDQFSRDFWAARKKREKEKWEEELEKLGRSESEELSPLYVQKKPTEQSWFQGSSAFEDGYQIGDITKVILGTGQDLTQNVVAGLSGIVESTVDAGAYLVGGAGKLLGADRFAEGVSKFIQKDLINEQKLGEYAAVGLTLPGFILTGGEDFDDLSVLGEKTDGLVQSAGQLLGTVGLQGLGVPWWVTSGVTSFGGQAEQALGEGASYGKAGASALISAGAEVLTEKLFGGSGLGEKGLINTEALTRGISNKVVKTLADWGVDMVTEGAEEVVSEVVSNLGTALYKEENVGQILGSEEALDSYLDSFIGGAVLGGVMNVPKAAGAIKNKTDYRNGLTANEQKVFDKVYEDAVAEAQKDGKTLSKKDKAALHDRLLGDIDKGYISTDTIEEVLGGENYKNYKRLAAESEEYEKLYDTPYEKLSEKQRDRLAELKKKNAETAYDDAVSDAYERLRQQVKKDGGKLVESYNERQRRGQKFQADTSKYSEAEASIVQKAIDSGVMNNTNRSHEFVDLVAKIGAEKGILFDFADNAKIKESGFGIVGKTVNGFVTKAGVTVNTQSQKALEKVVGHEITHILEGTELYQRLQTAIFDYAKGKGDFDSRRSALEQMYKDIEGADIDGELTADLVGDYLFTDEAFLKELSGKHRNVFQRIYDEIKHLCKLATAGTKEARQLEKVKKAFDEAYRATKNTAEDGGVKYSIEETTDGRFVAVVDSDILSNIDTGTWNDAKKAAAQKAAIDALKHFDEGIVVDGITRKVNRTSRREFTRSKYTESLYKRAPELFADKMRAAEAIDDIVIAATDWNRDGGLSHERADSFVDFDHGKTLIVSGNAKYSAEVVVGITNTGEAVFYDVVDLTPAKFDIKKAEPPTTATTQKAIGDIQGDSDKVNISQDSKTVNSKNSLSDEGSRQSGGRFDGEDLRWLNVTGREETSVPEPAAVQPEVDLLATDKVRGKTDTELERNLKQVNAEYQEYVRGLDRLIDEGNRGLADAQWRREYDEVCRKLEKAEAHRDRLQEEVDYRQRADSLAQMEAPGEGKEPRKTEAEDPLQQMKTHALKEQQIEAQQRCNDLESEINKLLRQYNEKKISFSEFQPQYEDLSNQLAKWEQKAKQKDTTARLAKTTSPVTESKPIAAKNDLRGTITALFSIPDGTKQEMGKIIDGYADRLVKNGSLTESDRQAFFRQMYEAGVMEIPANEYYAEARSYVKGGHIYISADVVADFGDDLQSVRRRAFANGIYLTTDQQYRNAGIDVWNHELADALPGLFDAEDTDLRSVLEHIIQVAEDGRAEKKSLAEYTQWLSGHENVAERAFLDNMERQMDQALRTFAEKADLEIKLRDRTGVKIAQERQAHQEAAQRAKERKELQQLQQKTLKQLQWLSKNRNKAPEELRAVFDEVLGDLDIYAVGAADEMRWSKKHEATWGDLSQMYQDARTSDPNFLPSKELEKIVARLNNSKIADLDIDALNDLYKAAVGLRTEYYNRNNVINDENHRLFAEVYNDIGQELTSAPGGYKGKTLDKLFNTDQLTPMNVLQRMAGWNPNSTFYTMAKQLETGERDMRAYKVKAQRQLQAFLTKNEAWVKTADGQGKNSVWHEVEVPELMELGMGDKPIFGDTVKVYMTPAQKVHLYLESKNYDNLRHMTGGRTFVNKELYSQGKRQEAFAQGKTIRLAPETVKQIVSKMTPQEMELANLLEKYYNQFSAQEINRVSNVLYGYDKAMGKNYAPIYSNSNYTNQEFGVFDSTAEGVGNLKGRVNSKKPTYNISAFDAFEKHMDQTARFVGMAIPARNWTTLMNWQQGNNSTGDIITHKWGQEGKNYITELITDLQNGGGTKTDVISSSIEKLQSNYISAVFGANPSIVLKQMGSIPLAGAYLGMKNFPSVAQIRSIDRELIAKYSQDLDWRTMGYSMPETKMLKDNPNWTQTNKFFKFTFGGGAITAMDGWAASTLWPWAENKVRREHPKLEVGTREQINSGESPFYKAVAEEFENALARSQSTSDEIHQSNLRKSKNAFTRVFTMFRSDSAQVYNAIRQKVGEAQYYMRSAPDSVEARKAKRAVGVTMATAISGFAMAEGVELLMNLWKRHGDGYRDEEEELTAESVLGEVGVGLLGDMAGVVVGGEELFELIGNVLTGEKWYGIDTMGMEQLNDCLEALSGAGSGIREIVAGCADVADKDGDVGEYFRSHENDILGGVKELAQTAATYLGIPANNVEAYLLGPMKWVSPALNTAYEDLFDTARKEDLAGLDGISLTVRIEDLLNNRNVGTSYKTADTLAALYEQGYKSAVPSSVPSSISVDGESRGLSEYEKQVYSDAWSGVVAGNLDDLVVSVDFAKADDETRAKMLDKLYRYADEQAKVAVLGDYEMSADTEKTMAVSKVVPVADFIGWDVAASAVQSDKDENGKTISGSRKKKIVALLNELDHLTYGQKIILYRAEYPSDDTYCADIVEYLNELDDLRYADRVTILAALGFRISEDGNMAYWD